MKQLPAYNHLKTTETNNMKRTIQLSLTALLVLVGFTLAAQTDTSDTKDTDSEIIIDGGKVKVIIKEKKIITKSPDGSDSNIERTVGKVEIIKKEIEDMEGVEEIEEIVEDELGRKIEKIVKIELEDELDEIFEDEEEEIPFIETDWFNTQIGLNGVINGAGDVTFNGSTESGGQTTNYANLDISTGKSINFHLHFVQQALNLYKGKVRLVYGVGIDFNNYRFIDDVDLVADSDPLATMMSTNDYKKNKLVTQYLSAPVMLDFNIGRDGDGLKIAGGPTFQYLVGSHQKQKWDGPNGKTKIKNRDDYNLEKYRMGYEVQFGYGSFVLYGKYFPNNMFKAGQGPEARAFSAGILLGHI